MAKILAIPGSYREHSYNKRVLVIAAAGALEAGAEVTMIDLRDHPMPVYDQDIQDAAFDENAANLQDLMMEHDGFLFATPEYNASIPGGLKNVIDWTSRPNDKYPMYGVYKGKTAAIVGSSPSQFGALRAMTHLRGVLTQLGLQVLPSEVAVTFVHQKFDGHNDEITDEKTRELLKGLGSQLVKALS